MTPEPYKGGEYPLWIVVDTAGGGTQDNANINEIMESSELYNAGDYPATIEELLDAMQDPSGRYKHLQIIFYRNKSSLGLGLGQQYLVVNQYGFGLYQLDDVDYSNGILIMMFTNPRTGNTAEIFLDVNNKHPEHFLICWHDVKQLLLEENLLDINDYEMLELDKDDDKRN